MRTSEWPVCVCVCVCVCACACMHVYHVSGGNADLALAKNGQQIVFKNSNSANRLLRFSHMHPLTKVQSLFQRSSAECMSTSA